MQSPSYPSFIRHILNVTGIDDHDGETAGHQYIEYWSPVNFHTLHGYVRNA